MDISVEPCRRRRIRPLPDYLALKWFCPGTRATILPRRVRRRRFEKDLFDFIVAPLCQNDRKKQAFQLETPHGHIPCVVASQLPSVRRPAGPPTSLAWGAGGFLRGRVPTPPK